MPPKTRARRGRPALLPMILTFPTVLAFLIIPALPGAAGPAASSPGFSTAAPDREFVIDGSRVHDAGLLWLNITNWGLIGSRPGSGAPYSEAPSARWPGESGDDHLHGAGLWVGGVLLGERLVSTGQYETEWFPTEDPLDTIYETARGAPGGNRYPWPDPDDDHDGAEDEDPPNGLDDDGDGQVDEDFAAISNQHFRCVNSDTVGLIQELYPDHTPLGLEVTQQSFQWESLLDEDFIGFDFTVRNVGIATLEDVYIGFFADCDIPAVAGGAEDDMAGKFRGMVPVPDGRFVPVSIGYMYDGADAVPVAGYLGFLLLDHTTDPAGVFAPPEVTLRSFQVMKAQTPFEQGGDPTNDGERYELISADQLDGNVPQGQQADYRILVASGPFPALAPADTLTYRIAMVHGQGLQGLLVNAAEAVLVYQGVRYDRDGDPSTGPDGKEVQVHWLPPDQAPVSAVSGEIRAQVDGVGVLVDVATNLEDPAEIQVMRRPGARVAERRWGAADFASVMCGTDGVRASVVDDEPAGWPRTYVLLHRSPYGDHALDRVEVAAPRLAPSLAAHPNPFNPQVEIRYWLPEPGAVEVSVFDARGCLVRTLVRDERPAGDGVLLWPGDDRDGRPAGSGVYLVQLRSEGSVISRTVTLVR